MSMSLKKDRKMQFLENIKMMIFNIDDKVELKIGFFDWLRV